MKTMNARRRSISNAREEFKRTVREAIVNLEDTYAFSHEHAVQSVLHEIVMFTGASVLVDEERVRIFRSVVYSFVILNLD